MATLTAEQIEQKKQQLKQLVEEVKALTKELVEAGAIELSEDDLDKAAGGHDFEIVHSHWKPSTEDKKPEAGHTTITYDPVWGKPIKVHH